MKIAGSSIRHCSSGATATVGGIQAPVSFSGLAPNFAGLYQVNVRIPAGVQSGNFVPVVVSINGAPSNPVTIAIR
jgi:uncharacterized protein (TIGR03437 family)